MQVHRRRHDLETNTRWRKGEMSLIDYSRCNACDGNDELEAQI